MKFYGKYRGTVINNIDPMQMCRIQAQIPDVLGLIPSTWALPCLPFTGQQSGLVVMPQVGAGVWMEFEQGDPDFPIWTGGWYGSDSEVPAPVAAGLPVSPSVVIQTSQQTSLVLSDLPGPSGGIALKLATGAMISITDSGITLTNGQGATISLSGPSVSINNGALEVT